MPQVPVYGGNQVRTQALQPVMQQAPDISSGGRALAQGMGQLAQAADQIDYRDAQDAAFKAEARLREDWNVQNSKLREQYKGDQADQYKVKADEWWAKAKETYTAELNPRAQGLAGRSLGAIRLAAQADTTQYVDTQKANARKVNYETTQSGLIRDASVSATPETAAAIASTMEKTLRENAQKHAAAEGFGSEVGDKLANEQLDRFHATMALSLANTLNGAEKAKAYLTEFGGNMPLETRTRVNEQIEVTADKAKTKATRDMYGTLRLSVERGVYPTRAQVDELAKLDPVQAATLEQAISAEKKARQAEARGEHIRTDFATWYDVQQKIVAGQPVDLLKYRDRISVADLKSLATVQQKPEKTFEAKMDQDDFNLVADSLALKPFAANKTEDEKRQLGMLKGRMEQLIDVAQQSKKAPLTREEKQQLMRTEMAKTVTVDPGMFSFNQNKPVILLDKEQAAQVVVPAARRAAISAKMAERYKNSQDPLFAPTEQNLRYWYLQETSRAAGLINNGN